MKNIYYCKYHPTKPWRIIVRHKGKQISGGYFEYKDQAIAALYDLNLKLKVKYNLAPIERSTIKHALREAKDYLDVALTNKTTSKDKQKLKKLQLEIASIINNY